MFSLIRRISDTVFPRPNRPWRDDAATSNAPQGGRKRRLSSIDQEPEDYVSTKKAKAAGSGVEETDGASDASERDDSPTRGNETEEVKEVTKGVKEVDLEAKDSSSAPLSSSEESAPPETQTEKDLEVGKGDGESERFPEALHDQTEDSGAELPTHTGLESTSDNPPSTDEPVEALPLHKDVMAKVDSSPSDTSKTVTEEETSLEQNDSTAGKGGSTD